MITREVNEWLRNVEMRRYSFDDAMQEFVRISRYLTKDELIQLKRSLEKSYK